MGAAPKLNDFGAAPRYRIKVVERSPAKGWAVITPTPDGQAEDDDALMALAAAGDEVAGRAIVERHLSHILAVARRMLGDQTEAEDVAQDTFMRAWAAAGRWEPGRAKLSTWLHRIAMNQCLDRLRKKKPEPLRADYDAASDDPDPEMQLQQQQLALAIDAAIQSLPERQRAAVVLSHYQQLGNLEAAEILAISVEALESLLSRGRKALRRALKPEWSELTGAQDKTSDMAPERVEQ